MPHRSSTLVIGATITPGWPQNRGGGFHNPFDRGARSNWLAFLSGACAAAPLAPHVRRLTRPDAP